MANVILKQCNTCGAILPETKEYFHQDNKGVKSGFRGVCKNCRRIQLFKNKHKDDIQQYDIEDLSISQLRAAGYDAVVVRKTHLNKDIDTIVDEDPDWDIKEL